MPHRPDTPCARCGHLLWSSTTSLPAGERVCLPCRRLIGRPVRAVGECLLMLGGGSRRAAYEREIGPIPAGMIVVQTCGTGVDAHYSAECVRPEHLLALSRRELMRLPYVGSPVRGVRRWDLLPLLRRALEADAEWGAALKQHEDAEFVAFLREYA